MAKMDIPDGWELITPKSDIPEGWTPVVGRGEDLARSTAAGLAEGTAGLVGGAGDIQKAVRGNVFDQWLTQKAQGAGRRLTQALGLPEDFFAGKKGGYQLARPEVGEVRLPTTEEVKGATGLHHFDYEPQYLTGSLAKGGASFVPGAVTGTSARSLPGVAADIFRFGLAPGVAQEGVGQLLKGTQYEGTPLETAARFGTSLVGGAAAGKFLSPNVSKAPLASQQNYQGQVRQLEEHGMPISPGERSDSRALRYGESEANPELGKERLEAVTRRATSAVGNGRGGNHGVNIMDHEPGPNNTINNILTETGNRVGNVWSRQHFIPDNNLGADIHNIANDYVMSNLYGKDTVERIAGAARELQDALHHAQATGQVTANGNPYLLGGQAHRLYSRMRGAARGSENKDLSAGLNRFADAIGDNMERSVAGTPHVGELAQANRDYRNALVIEKASKASNVAGAAGYITPAKVEEAASSIFGSRAHQRGFDDFSWAPAAKAVYKTMPDSGTSPRQEYQKMFEKWSKPIGFALGAGFGHVYGGATGALGSAAEHAGLMGGLFGEAAAAAPEYLLRKAAGVYSQSRLGQAHLGNQLLAGAPGPVYEKVYNPATGHTRKRYSVPGLLTAAETAALDAQRQRDREANQ